MRREVVELRLPAAGDPEPRSAPSPAAPSGAAPVPALAAPRARCLVQPEPWGRSRSEHHGAGGLVSLGAPPRPPAPRSRGHPRWVWHGEGAGRCGCAHGRLGPRDSVSSTTGRSGAMGRSRLPAPRPGGDQSSWGWGSHSEDHTGGRDRPPMATPGLPELREAPGTPRESSLKPARKVFLRRVCGALCVRARVSPLPSPLTLSQSSSSWQPPPPDWTGQDAFGVPSALPLPLPTPSGPFGLVSYSSFLRGRGGGGGGERSRSC